MKDILKGVFDIHVHTSPDVQPRKCSDTELAERLARAGMAGCAIKNHYFDTAGRAALVQALYPNLIIAGGIVLNLSHGGINPRAVEKLGQMKGKMLWFPTMDARAYKQFHSHNKECDLSQYITILDKNENLIQPVHEVLDIAREYNLTVGTGHLGATEGMALVREAKRRGVKHVVLTHADNPASRYSIEQQAEAASLGVMIEHSYFTTYYNRTPLEEIIRQIKYVGCEHIILSTDFGQEASPYSDEGMAEYMEKLIENGIPQEAVRRMACVNPPAVLTE